MTPETPAGDCELSIVLPCLDEAETVGACVRKALAFLEAHGVAGEVVVADNGSRDGSAAIATGQGARVVPAPVRGYGAALMAGFAAARGRYVVMADADDTYDLTALAPFLDRLRAGDELVLGNRFRGGIAPGAMPPLHRWLGNPVLSFLGRRLTGVPAGDFHCGLRGLGREALLRLPLRSPGMEFASEMIVLAGRHGLRVSEVPTTLACSARGRAPHLRTWRDGWRHLCLLLALAPRGVGSFPGSALLGPLRRLPPVPGPRLAAAGGSLAAAGLAIAAAGLAEGAAALGSGGLLAAGGGLLLFQAGLATIAAGPPMAGRS